MPLFGQPEIDNLAEKKNVQELIKALTHKNTYAR
jgi:hypothetical protein